MKFYSFNKANKLIIKLGFMTPYNKFITRQIY